MTSKKESFAERKAFILVAVLFLNLVLMSTQIILKNERSLFQNIIGFAASPFQIGFQKAVDFVSHQFQHYVFLKNTFRKYYLLKGEYRKLKYENYLLKRKIRQLDFLKEAKLDPAAFVGAELIAVDSGFPFDSVTINKGSQDGIKVDMVILNEEGHLVGKVIEPISLFSARVRLVTSAVGGVGAYIKKNRLEGFLSGDNGKICRFKYLLENLPVNIGDRVITSGTDEIFPPDIPIGKVVRVEKEYLTQEIYVKPFFVEKSIKHLIVTK